VFFSRFFLDFGTRGFRRVEPPAFRSARRQRAGTRSSRFHRSRTPRAPPPRPPSHPSPRRDHFQRGNGGFSITLSASERRVVTSSSAIVAADLNPLKCARPSALRTAMQTPSDGTARCSTAARACAARLSALTLQIGSGQQLTVRGACDVISTFMVRVAHRSRRGALDLGFDPRPELRPASRRRVCRFAASRSLRHLHARVAVVRCESRQMRAWKRLDCWSDNQVGRLTLRR